MRYKELWGQDALVPYRKQPYSQQQLQALVVFLSAHSMVGWSATLHLAMLVLICFCVSTGTRKDEWALSFEGDTFLRRSNFCWDTHGP